MVSNQRFVWGQTLKSGLCAHTIAHRLAPYLERDAEHSTLTLDDSGEEPIDQLRGHSLPDGTPSPNGSQQAWETGFKDTVIAHPGEITTVKALFDIEGFLLPPFCIYPQ